MTAMRAAGASPLVESALVTAPFAAGAASSAATTGPASTGRAAGAAVAGAGATGAEGSGVLKQLPMMILNSEVRDVCSPIDKN